MRSELTRCWLPVLSDSVALPHIEALRYHCTAVCLLWKANTGSVLNTLPRKLDNSGVARGDPERTIVCIYVSAKLHQEGDREEFVLTLYQSSKNSDHLL